MLKVKIRMVILVQFHTTIKSKKPLSRTIIKLGTVYFLINSVLDTYIQKRVFMCVYMGLDALLMLS